MKVEWSPLALERVDDIAQYIAQDNPEAAVRWVIYSVRENVEILTVRRGSQLLRLAEIDDYKT